MRVIPAEDWSVELFRDSAPALGRLLRSTANTSTAAKQLWALTQINKVSETAALTEGQRIVIPHSVRQKLPSSPAANAVTSDAPTEH
jgi:hypothetical protein